MGEREVSSTVCKDIWISTYNKRKLDPNFTSHVKINSKFTKDLNIRSKTFLYEENIGVNHCDLGFGNGFQDMTLKP